MPAYALQLYAKWIPIKVRALLIPNGGELEAGQAVRFHKDPSVREKIDAPAEPSRDYVRLAPDENGIYHGLYNYDDVNGHYTMDPDAQGEYNIKAGAYIFQGWYEAVLESAPLQLVEYKLDKYTYAYGNYVEASGGSYKLVNGQFELATAGDGTHNFVDATPQKNADGSYKVGRLFDFGTAPTEPVTLVAVWQRAGGFRVVYDVKDPDLGLTDADYKGVTAPEDTKDYLEGAHATVLAPIAAPKGYALDYWTDKNGGQYKPNELVAITEANGDPTQSGDMAITLTAHYRTYDPTARDMADYTFRVLNQTTGEYDVYELQRISVNEELKAPITPTPPEGYAFKGWYLDTEGRRIFNGFGVIASPTYTTLYAVFERVFTVTYYLTDATKTPNEPTASVIATQTYTNPGVAFVENDADNNKLFQHLDTRGVTHPVDNDHYVAMWVSNWANQTVSANQYQYNTMTDKYVTADLSLYAVLNERLYVNFDSQGGTFVDMQEIPQGGWPVRPDEPTRAGYVFEGWWTKSTGGVQYNFDAPIDELKGSGENQDPDFNPQKAVLYAHWASDGSLSSDFTIIWWAETAEGNGNYEFQKSAKATGTVGVVTNTADYLASHTTYDDTDNLVVIAEEKRPYFEYNSTESDSSFEVEADGSTVLNLRFTRIRYTYRFKPVTSFKIVYNGQEFTYASYNNGVWYQFEVWVDKEIAAQWPMVDNTRNPHIEITDTSTTNRATGVTWHVGSRDIMAVETSASTDRLQNADSNRVVEFTASNVTTSQTTIIRYYLGASEAADYRSVIKQDISPVSTKYNGLQYNRTFLAKTITGYHPIVITDGDTPILTNGYLVRGKDVGAAATDTTNYNRIYGRYDTQDVASGTTTYLEDYTVDVYSYARKDNVKYYVWDSRFGFDDFYPVDITFHNERETKNSYEVTYTDNNGTTHQVTGGTIYYVPNGAEPYRIGVGLLARTNTRSITWDNFVNNAIRETVTTEPRQREVTVTQTGTKIKYVTFYYAKNIYKVNLMNGTTPYGSVNVEYEKYVPAALAAAGITDPVSTQEGMTFAGWSITEDTVEPYNYNMPAYNLTLYATWKPVEYTVTTLGVDIYGSAFKCNDEGREIDADGNLVEDGKVSATYTAKHGQQLKELGIPNPKKDSSLFGGWLNNATNGPVTGVYEIKADLDIRPEWNDLELRHVTYDVNYPADFPKTAEAFAASKKYAPFEGTAPSAPTDGNEYIVGAKATIKDGGDLYINRVDVKGQTYKASFAYWEDSEGNRYYPNTVFVFRKGDDTGLVEDTNGVKNTLALKAVYSEFRETVLTYDKNDGGTGTAKFIMDDGSGEDYTVEDINGNKVNMKDGPVEVLYRDEKSEGFNRTKGDMIPNETFPVGQDQNNQNFTVIRTDDRGNTFVLAGWSDDQSASVPLARNGDKAYVNTITDAEGVLRNTLYAIWGICKVVDKNGDEHVFDTIQKAVNFISTTDLLATSKTGTIEMLIDYKKPNSDAPAGSTTGSVEIPADCNITLTTALQTQARLDAGERLFYTGSLPVATITRAENGGSMFANEGAFTVTNITLDGGSKNNRTCSTDGGIINSSGTLTVTTGAVLQNSNVGNYNGGAIYASAGTVNINGDSNTIIGGYAGAANTAANGGGIYVGTNASVTVSGSAEISHNTATANGGGIYSAGTVSMTGGSINRNAATTTVEGAVTNGGGVYSSGTFSISGGSIEHNSATTNGGGIYSAGTAVISASGTVSDNTAANGGAMYAVSGTTSTVTGGTFHRNTATSSGAGIYLDSTATLKLSGAPSFGGSDTDGDGNIQGENGNFLTGTLPAGTTNGGKPYTRARQDIFLTETAGNDPASIIVNGDLNYQLAGGTIWVWAVNDGRYKQRMPFAKMEDVEFVAVEQGQTVPQGKLDAAKLKAFRNARPDDETENGTDTFLFGTIEGEVADQGIIYWTGSSGSRKVILRAVIDSSGNYSSGSGTFEIRKGSSTSAYVLKHKGAADETLTNLSAGASGVFWIGELPYATDYSIWQGNSKICTLTVGDDTTVNGVETAPGSRDGVTVN